MKTTSRDSLQPQHAIRTAGDAFFPTPLPHQPQRGLYFTKPTNILVATTLEEVIPTLAEAEHLAEKGAYALGFLAYEAAPAFDTAMVTHPPGDFPLAWFAIYQEGQLLVEGLPLPAHPASKNQAWSPSLLEEQYVRDVDQVKALIAAGDTYQVNHTFRMQAFLEDENTLPLNTPQTTRIDTGDHLLVSASPELFFERSGDHIMCRPMKGTAARGTTLRDDHAQAQWLKHSAKNRAENLMIVDMIRNDLGRIARPGSIDVSSLFDIEKYDSLFQMTSTVTAKSSASLPEIFTALFPCASVTGAPKIRTMEIIRQLEAGPRGIYTGCIGLMEPNRKARFNVAIRTCHLEQDTKILTYGTGSGLVWDSDPGQEYQECLTKTLVLTDPTPPFSLLETLLWTPAQGYWLLDEHMERLSTSATYFDIPLAPHAALSHLDGAATAFGPTAQRVRLLVDRKGVITVEHIALPEVFQPPQDYPANNTTKNSVPMATHSVDREERFLYHKTTHRKIYAERTEGWPLGQDVLLWNEQREITESTMANFVAQKGDAFFTPPVSAGLLPGTFRARLLREGLLTEETILLDDLPRYDAFFLINSVRGWQAIDLIS